MTIKYALTRVEIVRALFQGLGRSPKFLAVIFVYSIGMGMFLSRPLAFGNALSPLAGAVFAFLLAPVWLFVRARTGERSLTLSLQGISAGIGSFKEQVPWSKVSITADPEGYLLMTGWLCVPSRIPSRAFAGPAEQSQFRLLIDQWRNVERENAT